MDMNLKLMFLYMNSESKCSSSQLYCTYLSCQSDLIVKETSNSNYVSYFTETFQKSAFNWLAGQTKFFICQENTKLTLVGLFEHWN